MLESVQQADEKQTVVESTVWVARVPQLQTVLDLANTAPGDLQGSTHIEVWNPQGELVNEMSLELKSASMASFDLGLLVAPGNPGDAQPFNHATIYIRSPQSYSHSFRLVGARGSHYLRGCQNVFRTAPFFSFLTPPPGEYPAAGETFYGLMNDSDEEIEVQCRLYFDRFYREIIRLVPPQGATILSVEQAFEEVLAAEEESPQYLRVAQKSERDGLLVQTLELVDVGKGMVDYIACS